MSKKRMNSKITVPVSTKCAALITTETRPKITALEFQGNFEDGPEMINPGKSHAKLKEL